MDIITKMSRCIQIRKFEARADIHAKDASDRTAVDLAWHNFQVAH